jgi:hypothetical protein
MYNKIRVSFFVLFLIIAITLKTNRVSGQKLEASTPKEKKILSLVLALPEVQKRSDKIKALSHGQTQITLRISANPDIYIPYYQVNVNDGPPTYKNYYQFAVNPKTYQIFYYDAVKNRQYSLAEWRKFRGKDISNDTAVFISN